MSNNSNAPVANGVVGGTPKTPSGSRSVASDVLRDDQGNVIRCEAVVKKTSAPCKNNAKFRIGNQCVCGLHAKSVNNAQPDPNKKPGTANKVPPKGQSSFGNVVGVPGSSTSNNFSNFMPATDDVPDIADDE